MFLKNSLVLALVATLAACSKSEDFFQKSKIEASEEIDTSAKVSSDGKEFSIIAKDLLLAQSKLPSSSEAFSLAKSENLPPGAVIDESSGKLEWQSDLQDIGKSFSTYIDFKSSLETTKNHFKFNVLPPSVKKNECSFTPTPVIGSILPKLNWHWKGWNDLVNNKNYYLTFSAPVAGDLDKDGVVEIVTMISTSSYRGANGPIVVLDGNSGEVLWNSMLSSGFGAEVSTTPAIADLNGDGFSEIIAIQLTSTGNRVIIIDYVKRSIIASYDDGFICGTTCIPAVGDIDSDGKAEIVVGNVILDHAGSRKYFLSPTPTSMSTYQASTTSIAELNSQSSGLEIIANGSQVYSNKGQLLWKGDCLGFSAVGDLDQDGKAELVCSGGGHVSMYSEVGTLSWTKPILGGGVGGAPNIGKFLNNGEQQIGLAGGSNYLVFDKDGETIWSTATQDLSSSSTGSTIFDFNGDGKVEVVYNDETHLRIYDGSTGAIIWSTPNVSGTLWEYPLIVDINNDQSADIVVSAPGWHSGVPKPDEGGIKVFSDPTKKWVNTRKVWNQYSYYPELISDKLLAVSNVGIPKYGFRVNDQGALISEGKTLLPDINVHIPLFADDSSGLNSLTFYLANQGEANSDSEKVVYVVDADDENVILGSKTFDSQIKANSGLLVQVNIDKSKLELHKNLKVLVKQEKECNYENNSEEFSLKSISR